MASTAPLSSPNMLQLPVRYSQFHLILTGIAPSLSKCEFSGKLFLLQRSKGFLRSIPVKKGAIKCFSEPKEREGETEVINKDEHDVISDDVSVPQEFSNGSVGSARSSIPNSASGDSLNLGIREPVYEVVEVRSDGNVSTRKIMRRHLLKSSGLRPRDIRSVDPSLWLTNSMPSLLTEKRDGFHRIPLNEI